MYALFDRKLFNSINDELIKANRFLEDAKVSFRFLKIEQHFIDRVNDRDIDPYNIIKVVSFLLKNKLHEICTGIIVNSNFNRLTIQYARDFFIHATYSIGVDSGYKIKFRTTIAYRQDYSIEGAFVKINKLKGKDE